MHAKAACRPTACNILVTSFVRHDNDNDASMSHIRHVESTYNERFDSTQKQNVHRLRYVITEGIADNKLTDPSAKKTH